MQWSAEKSDGPRTLQGLHWSCCQAAAAWRAALVHLSQVLVPVIGSSLSFFIDLAMLLVSGAFVVSFVFYWHESWQGFDEIPKAWHHSAAAFVLGDDQIARGCQAAASLTACSGKDQKSRSIQGKGKDSSESVVLIVASQVWFCWDLVAAALWVLAVSGFLGVWTCCMAPAAALVRCAFSLLRMRGSMEGAESSDQVFANVQHEDHIESAKPVPLEGEEGPPPPKIVGGVVCEKVDGDKRVVKKTLLKVKAASSSSTALCG